MEFEEGQEVEVSVEDLKESWYTAKVIALRDRNGDKEKILIEYSEKPGLTPLKGFVDIHFVRPRYPFENKPSSQFFQLNQQVDAFHGNGWWKGTIVRVVNESEYTVHFHNSKGLHILDFQLKDLRVHLDWIGGRWVRPHDEVWSGGRWVTLQQQVNINYQGTELRAQNEEKVQSPNPTSTSSLWTDIITPQTPTGVMEYQTTRNRLNSPSYAGLSSQEKMQQSYPKITAEVLKPCRRVKEVAPTDAESVLSFPGDTKLCRVAGLPKTYVEYQKQQHMKESPFDGVGLDNQARNAMKNKRGEARICENEFASYKARTLRDASFKRSFKQAGLIFEKRSDMWQIMESMEVFKLMPQEPHFRPLITANEEAREGISMSYMLSFANLAEKTIREEVDDPRSKMNTLSELEKLGFNVVPIRHRLEELIINNKLAATERELIHKVGEFDEIQESITRLNIVLKSLVTENKMSRFKVAQLQKTADESNQTIQDIRLEFDSVVASVLLPGSDSMLVQLP